MQYRDDDDLRFAIVGGGGDGERQGGERARRRKFRNPRRLVRAALGGALAVAGLALALGVTLDSGPGSDPARTLSAGAVVALDSRVHRTVAPQMPDAPMMGHVTASLGGGPQSPPRPVPGRAPGRTLETRAIVEGDAPRLADLLGTRAAGAALAYAPAGDWAGGACGLRRKPEGPAYCDLDGTLYAEAETRPDTLALFALAHQIGMHVESRLGLMFDPASGERRTLRRDCLAGAWARGADTTRAWLFPERLARKLDPEGAGGWPARRAAAFRTGYLASGPSACNDPVDDA